MPDPHEDVLETVFEALVAQGQVAEAYHDDVMQRIDALRIALETHQQASWSVWVGAWRVPGVRWRRCIRRS